MSIHSTKAKYPSTVPGESLIHPQTKHFGIAKLPAEPFCKTAVPYNGKISFDEVSTLAELCEPNTARFQELWCNWRREQIQVNIQNPSDQGMRYYALHSRSIKDLNERLFNATGTEEYLELLHRRTHDLLFENPELGVVLHSNYKNHFIASFLEPDDFLRKVFAPLQGDLLDFLYPRVPPPPGSTWDRWGNDNFSFAFGDDLLSTHYWTQRNAYRWGSESVATDENIAVDDWRRAAKQARRTLINEAAPLCSQLQIKWTDVLDVGQKFLGRNQGGPEGLALWAGEQGYPQIPKLMINYFQFLQMGHFFPFRDSPKSKVYTPEEFLDVRKHRPLKLPVMTWEVERSVAFQNGFGAGHVAAIDLERFGYYTRRAQDAWIRSGAHFNSLMHVFDWTTAAKDHITRELNYHIGKIAGQPVTFYHHTGDENLIFIPDGMSGRQLKEIDGLLMSYKSSKNGTNGKRSHYFGVKGKAIPLSIHYSGLVPVQTPTDPFSFAEAVVNARRLVKAVEADVISAN